LTGGQGAAAETVTRKLASRLFRLDEPCRLFRWKRRGASAVEFAVVAPVFLLLVFGMIEYGRMVMVQQVITHASREGARRAILGGATEANVQTVVEGYLANASIQGAVVTVDPPDLSSVDSGAPVTVTVQINFSQVSWLPSPMYLGAAQLRASSVMRRETVH
jgi:Flp pilus assembly protein TadG